MRPSTVYVLFQGAIGLSMGSMSTAYSPFLVSLGITLPQIALVNAGYFVTIVLAELPTGMLADGQSRAWAVRTGAFIHAMGLLAYAFISGFWGALACEIAVGVGFAFLSGAEQAWITDALIKRGEQGQLQRIFGTAGLARSLSMLVGGICGALIAAHGLQLAVIVAGCIAFLSVGIALFLMRDNGEPAERSGEFDALRQSLGALRTRSGLIWAMTAATSGALVLSFNHYWALFFRELTGQAGLSYVWLAVYGGCTVGGWLVRHGTIGRQRPALAVVMSIVLIGLGMAFIGFTPGIVPPLMLAFVHEIGRGMFKPLLDVYTQQRVESSYRATYGSLQSFVCRLGFALVLLVIWLVTCGSVIGPGFIGTIWLINGLLTVLIAGLLWMFRPKS